MKKSFVNKGPVKGELTFPGDKSISHRAIILGSICNNEITVKNFSWGEDNVSTVNIFKKTGVTIDEHNGNINIKGVGLKGLKEPENILYAGNSGTTMRLMTGLLSGQNFFSVLTGDDSLRKRPMGRVIDPLLNRGAKIWGRENNSLAPIAIKGSELKEFSYKMKVASAQVKSAILLSGLIAKGKTKLIEAGYTRDHTERMLSLFNADIKYNYPEIELYPAKKLIGKDLVIPGDISSASFFMVLGLIVPDSEIIIKDILLNPSRTGIIEILKMMGGNIEITNYTDKWEPRGDLIIRSSALRGMEISGDLIVKAIDEIPVISIAALFAQGITTVKDAVELRYKESDRINALITNFKKINVKLEEYKDGFSLEGKSFDIPTNVTFESFSDHRIAMSFAVLGAAIQKEITIDNFDPVNISFPKFEEYMESLWEN